MPENNEDLTALLKKLAELAPEDWRGTHATAEAAGVKLKTVAENIVKTMADTDLLADTFKGKTPDEVLILSARIVRASLEQDLVVPATPYTVYALGKTAPFTGKSKQGKAFTVSNLVGVGKKGEAGSPLQFLKIALFGDDVKKLEGVSPGKTYNVVLKGSNPTRLSLPDGETFVPSTEEGPGDPKEALLKLFNVVAIKDAAEHVRKNAKGLSMSDLKLVKARIVFANRKNRQDGSEYGQLLVLDDSVDPVLAKKGGGLNVFLDPSWIRVGPGSIVYVLGTISRREQAASNNPFVMNGEALVPEGTPLPLPKQKAAEPATAKTEAPKAEAFDFSKSQFDLED